MTVSRHSLTQPFPPGLPEIQSAAFITSSTASDGHAPHPHACLVGWEMAIGYLMAGVISCITIVGIPFGLQAFKMMKLAFLPFGATVN